MYLKTDLEEVEHIMTPEEAVLLDKLEAANYGADERMDGTGENLDDGEEIKC